MTSDLNKLKAFYKHCNLNYKDISIVKFLETVERSKEFNKLYNCEHFKETKRERYLRLMELFNSNCSTHYEAKSKYYTSSNTEKLVLFMYSVDPNFEATIIYASENKIDKIKDKLTKKFGIYDQNLIKVEKFVINNFLAPKEKQELNDEIIKRIF